MTKGLVRKKSVRAGHRGSTARILTQINEVIDAEQADLAKLAQFKPSLEEKLQRVPSSNWTMK